MKPDRIFLLRHGQSQGNENRNIYKETPDYAIQLTDKGKKQAQDVALKIRDIVKESSIQYYVSPYWRTRQTYIELDSCLHPKIKNYYEDPRLREQEWGHLRHSDLTSKMEEYRDNYGQFYYRFSDGESCADVFDRTSDFMNTMFRDFEKIDFPRNVIIITHGMTMRLFLMRWFHANIEEFEKWKNPYNCGYYLMERGDNEKYKLTTPLKIHNVKHKYQFDWKNTVIKNKLQIESKL